MSGRGRGGHRDDRGGRRERGGRGGSRGDIRRGGGPRRGGDRDHELEMRERAGDGGNSPTKPFQEGGRQVFKVLRNAEREKQEQQRQLDQEFPALGKSDSPTKETKEENNPDIGNVILKQREGDIKRSESPAVVKTVTSRKDSVSDKSLGQQTPRLRSAIKLVDENQIFCDGVSDYLLPDNTDFLVLGVLGLQNVGKSTVVNALVKLVQEEEDVFRVQTYEHQMLAEHCTNGIDVFINSRRILLLDCQPLLSASVMDRTIQLEKKFTSEFNSCENTMEVHSLQQVGFLLSVCHTVLLVQDWVTDINLIRLLLTAEMLKPVTPTVSGDNKTMSEYFPHLVIVHNKAEFTDLQPCQVKEVEKFYSHLLEKSRLQWKVDGDDSKPLVVYLPDQEGERADSLHHRIAPETNFDRAVKNLRKTVFSLKQTPLTQTKLTEKGWVTLANRTWDNIKNSPFYMEYSRLLP